MYFFYDLFIWVFVGGLVFAFVKISRLNSKVDRLENMLSGQPKNTQVVGTPESTADPSMTDAAKLGQETNSQYIPAQVQAKQQMSQTNLYKEIPKAEPNVFMEWLKEDLLMKIGGLFLLMALGWFVSYAFIHDWIGPAGRISMGLLAGVALLILGVWRIRTREHQGAIFTVLGSTTILLTLFAARTLYDMFTPVTALILMFLTVVFVTFVSLKYKRNSLALAGLILAGVAPYLTADPSPEILPFFFYLLVIVSGTLWVVYATGWRDLTFAALILVFLETIQFSGSSVPDIQTLSLLWAFLFVSIFFIANMVSIIRVRGAELTKAHMFTALGTAMYLVYWIFVAAPKEAQSLLFVFWMLVFSFGAFIVYKNTNNRAPFYVYGATSIGLLAAATIAELNGALLTTALTIEITALVFAAKFINLDSKAVNSLCALFTVPIVLSFESIVSSSWHAGILHEDFFVLVVLALSLLTAGLFIHERSEINDEDDMNVGGVLILGGILYALVLVWLVLHALMSGYIATTVALIVYTIIGITAFIHGQKTDNKNIKVAGGALLGFVVGHLLLVDLGTMSLAGRIVTFLVIGVLLVSTAFIGRKHKEDIDQITNQ